jgi:hypothetical protein
VRGSATLSGGALVLSLGAGGPVRAGDAVSVHVGDHVVASGELGEAADGGLGAVLPVGHLPGGEGAVELRVLLGREGSEMVPPLAYRDRDAFLAAFGPVEMAAAIATFDGGRIGFRVRPAALPGVARRFTLVVNGREAGTERAEVRADEDDAEPVQEVAFAVSAGLLREGVLVELVDAASGVAVFNMPLTWLALSAGVLEAHRRTSLAQARLGEELARLRARTAALLDASREQMLLERLDLYHAMLMDRLDREFVAIRRELGLGGLDGPAGERAEALRIDPHALEGAGIYDVEWEGETHWRWFGPEATVLLRDLPANLLALRVHCAVVPEGVSLRDATCRVNGVPVAPAVAQATPPALDLPVPPEAQRRDGSVILHLRFASAHTPAGDARALTIACSGIEALVG